jgi:ribonuclease R
MREFPSPSEILKVFEEHPAKTFRLRELVVALRLRSSQAWELRQSLGSLARRGKIAQLKKHHFALAQMKSGQARRDAPAQPVGGRRAQPFASSPAGASRARVVSGRLIGHRDGFGFVVPDAPLEETDQDIYVRAEGMGSAMHGDRVEVRVVRAGRGGRLEGLVHRVVERAQKTLVGEFHCGPRGNSVVPFERRIPYEIVIPRGAERPRDAGQKRDRQFGGESETGSKRAAAAPAGAEDLEGMIVEVELTEYPRSGVAPRGRVVELLGRRDDFGVDVEIIIRKYHLPHRFPAAALEEAEAKGRFVPEPERAGRRDFRALPIVTIDGETAKDFDDAVYVERLAGGGYLLHVHIADVAHHVRPSTALDREARLRGTSVYFPDRAVPMLPLELSNGICSLNPRVDRLVMSALMEFDAEGRPLQAELLPGVIRSAERMTYTAVRDVLAGEPAAGARYAALAGQFKLMEELAKLLNRRRTARGSIDFDLPEPEIEFDAQGQMVGVTRSERSMAHRLIEEFMLAANETVASYLEGRGVPALYRVHEKPEARKVLEFEQIASRFGYSLGIELPPASRWRVEDRGRRERYPRFHEQVIPNDLKITPFHYQRLTRRLEGKPEERILSYLMLRSLKQARYAEENLGHFALASPTYTHFTSPIRRYPDLIVHRVLKWALASEGGSARVKPGDSGKALPARTEKRHPAELPGGARVSPEELRALAVETSEAERRAQDAERELMDWKKVKFMAGRLGDEFDALIISLIKYGFFVELTDLFVEGFVPLETLEDDRYIYRERLRAMVGRDSGKSFQLGDRLRVRLDRIDREGNKLIFSVAE